MEEKKVLFKYEDLGSIEYIEVNVYEIFAKVTDSCEGPSSYPDEGAGRSCS